MIKELMYKLFGLEPMQCAVCEVLRQQLDESNHERKELLTRALAPPSVAVENAPTEPKQPINKSQFVPWRIRQQMLENEDRKKAQLMKDKANELASLSIGKLEKELNITSAAGSSVE